MWTAEERLCDPRSPVFPVLQQNNCYPEHASVFTSAVHVEHTQSVSAISRLISLPRRGADFVLLSGSVVADTTAGGGGATVCHEAKLPLYN